MERVNYSIKTFFLNTTCYVFHIHKQEQELIIKTENGILESIKTRVNPEQNSICSFLRLNDAGSGHCKRGAAD